MNFKISTKWLIPSLALSLVLLPSPVPAGELYLYNSPEGKRIYSDPHIYRSGYTPTDHHHRATKVNSPSGQNTKPAQYESLINSYAKRHHIENNLLKTIIFTESNYDTYALSRSGSRGLMQLSMALLKQYGGQQAYDPEQNIASGSAHLSYLLARYDNQVDMAIAALKVGEINVDKYQQVPPFIDVKRHLRRVRAALKTYRRG